MFKCLKCGASLPPVGDCPTCAAASQPAGRALPSLLDKDIQIDRRLGLERDASAAPVPPPVAPATPPGMTARPPVPPGLTPVGSQTVRPSAPGTPGLPVMPPRSSAPAARMAPAPQAPAMPSAHALRPQVVQATAPRAPVPPAPQAPAFNPPGAPAPKAPASQPGESLEVHARPASLWRRLLALTIDTSAIAGVAALYLMLASSVAGVRMPETGLSGLDAFVIQLRALQSVLVPGLFLVLVLSLVYCTVSAFLWNGRTLGRRLLGLRLVDTHGLAPSPGRAVIRALLASVSFGFFLAGFWMALFDRRGQTLHDKLTSTYVVQPS